MATRTRGPVGKAADVIADRYSLEREIGRGGMGAVWLGHDAVLGRDVALKRIGLMPGASTPDARRAEREARLAAMVSHPNVVAVFDLAEDGDDTWLVMEHVDGESLGQRLTRRGAMPVAAVIPFFEQCAAALLEAHSAGIVHRDVKPSNIMVTASGEAKLADFGIARNTADPSLTQTGLVTGSPAYLAPEVASGAQATSASDVWSLGATLFHALSGAPPYEVGDNLMGALYRIVHEAPPRLENAGSLGTLLDHTMVHDPSERWTMQQVRDHLRELQAGGPATQVMTPLASRHPRRGPWLPWLLGGAALVAALALGTWLVQGGEPDASAGDGSAQSPTTTSSPPKSSNRSPARPTEQETEAAMEQFAADYLATAPSDPRATYAQLTPDFQAASGFFEGYRGFWGGIESATLEDVSADPEDLVLRYRVRYVTKQGGEEEDDVELQLVRDGEGFKIAGEA